MFPAAAAAAAAGAAEAEKRLWLAAAAGDIAELKRGLEGSENYGQESIRDRINTGIPMFPASGNNYNTTLLMEASS